MNVTMAGNGTLDDGLQRYNLTDVNVRINGEQCQITLITGQQQRLEMTGHLLRASSTRCIITSSNRGRTSANALILGSGNMVTGVDVGGNINGRNFQGHFRSR